MTHLVRASLAENLGERSARRARKTRDRRATPGQAVDTSSKQRTLQVGAVERVGRAGEGRERTLRLFAVERSRDPSNRAQHGRDDDATRREGQSSARRRAVQASVSPASGRTSRGRSERKRRPTRSQEEGGCMLAEEECGGGKGSQEARTGRRAFVATAASPQGRKSAKGAKR